MTTAGAAFGIGLAALDNGREEQALSPIEAAIREFPGDARLWQVKGLLYRSLDDLAPAVAAFGQAAVLAPRDARIAHGHAHAAFEAGLPATALFRTALALAADIRTVLPGLAAATLAEEGANAASTPIDAQLRKQPMWLEGHWILARLRWMAGDRAGSTASIERALRDAPGDPGLWHQLIAIQMHSGHHEQALQTIARAGGASGAHPALLVAQAACLTETWQLAAADRAFAALPPSDDVASAIPFLRHALRSGRADLAAARGEALSTGPAGHMFVPYLSIAWRLLGDPRWDWLEGDDRLIATYDLRATIPSPDLLATRLRSLHRTAGQPLEQSLRGGTQTDGPLLSRIEPEIRLLRAAAIGAVRAHIDQLPPADARHPLLARPRHPKIRFSGSWSVRLHDSGHHTFHVHPAGWLSSALHIALPGKSAEDGATAGWLALGQPPIELGLNLPPIRLIEPRIGHLALFPSTMWHGTMPFSHGERISVAFDVAR